MKALVNYVGPSASQRCNAEAGPRVTHQGLKLIKYHTHDATNPLVERSLRLTNGLLDLGLKARFKTKCKSGRLADCGEAENEG